MIGEILRPSIAKVVWLLAGVIVVPKIIRKVRP